LEQRDLLDLWVRLAYRDQQEILVLLALLEAPVSQVRQADWALRGNLVLKDSWDKMEIRALLVVQDHKDFPVFLVQRANKDSQELLEQLVSQVTPDFLGILVLKASRDQ